MGETPREAVARSEVPELELLGRLVYAEATSTGFPDDPRVASAIAWGVMNRVRLAEAHPRLERSYGAGIAGVVFKDGQFNPAVSPRSRFSGDFLCPRHDARWETVMDAARTAWAGEGNPFIDTEWEREHGLSLVVNYYYPASEQARGDVAPWENDGRLRFIGEVELDGGALSADRVRFYRLVSPPGP